MTLRPLIYGRNGQLGRALHKRLRDTQAIFLDRENCDLKQSDKIIENSLAKVERPDIVIIAAAYTQVDSAENDNETAFLVNEIAPKIISQACAERGIPVIYISTDYVFDGTSTKPYMEGDVTNPLNIYGASKLAGEKAILNSGARSITFRTSWIFDGSSQNFFTTMLRLAIDRHEIDVVSDQVGRPTYAGHLADSVINCAKRLYLGQQNLKSTYNITGSGDIVSWAQFAEAIFNATKHERTHNPRVNHVLTTEFPRLAKRPTFSALDLTQLEDMLGGTLPDWKCGLQAAIKERHHSK